MLMKNHKLSNADQKEIGKLFNLFEGPFIITKIIGENILAIISPATNKEELLNMTEARLYNKASGTTE